MAFPAYAYQSYKEPTWWERNRIVIITILVGLCAINAIFISKAFRGDYIDPEKADHLGSFIGGYIGSMFGLSSVVFLYLTLRDTRRTSNIEKFENKYFELIRLHRDNVSEIGIGHVKGKGTFVKIIREFRAALPVVQGAAAAQNIQLNNEETFIIAYLIVFYGVGINSTRQLEKVLANRPITFVQHLIAQLERQQQSLRVHQSFNFTPFEGHQSRLGHYYRHLYQTITFIDAKNDIPINKYEYAKTVRAQLTNHEQALLFINALTPLGRNWWDKGLLVRYKLVKNIPQSFFDEASEIELTSYFPTDYFEWQ
jgi:hypothetical protein